MSEPFLERLSRFTPDAGTLDRDAMLFATGRASARPNRGWITLAALLAGTQALSLVLLWPNAVPPRAGSPGQVATKPAPPRGARPSLPKPSVNPGLLSARRRWLESGPASPPDTGNFVEGGPPLRAFGSPPPSILH
jgi:hypothetical protein